MRWAVRHETIYRYDVPVVLAPHVLHLTPMPDRARVLTRTLAIEPSPSGVEESADVFGNPCTRVTFDPRPSDVLRIHSHFEAETFEARCLEDVDLPRLPWPLALEDGLAAFRRTGDPVPEVEAFAREIAVEAGRSPLAFLEGLCHRLYTRIERHVRLDGAAQDAARTLAVSRGACRDLTVLFLATCRAVGIPGRFVSGYQGSSETRDTQQYLHAWPEVFLPGAGWQGWDPMYGVRAGEGHVALSAAPEQAGTMPVEGGFFFDGPTVTSTLEYTVRLERAA